MDIVLLNDSKPINQLIKEDINKSIVDFIEAELAKDEYNFIVTSENIAFAKNKMAELNKSSKFIDDFRKNKVAAESVAIDTFKQNIKDYIALIDAKREKIKQDVEVFESETKRSIEKELNLYVDELIKTQNIREEFCKDINISDLIVLGSATSKGALTKKARESVESRIMSCKMKQDKYDMRLMKLENLSYQNGLESPLTITHVQGIIYLESDAQYEEKLQELISSELNRQNIIKANLEKEANEKAEREVQQKILNEQNRIRNIFDINFNNPTIEYVDSKIKFLMDYDTAEFNNYDAFANSLRAELLSKLQNIKIGLLQANEIKEQKHIEVVHEVIEEKPLVKDTEIAPGKKVVKIAAVFEVIVPAHVEDIKVLQKVEGRLLDCGIDADTIKSLEVI